MLTTNFLKMVGDILKNPQVTSDATQDSFVDNRGNTITVGIVMPSNNDADVYALLNRRMDEDSGLGVRAFTQAQASITPTTNPTGSAAGLSVLSDCVCEYADGTISLIYTVSITNMNDSDITIASLSLEKSSYNFEYDSGYSEWNHYKNTYDMVYSVVNLDEAVTLAPSDSKVLIVKETVDVNI